MILNSFYLYRYLKVSHECNMIIVVLLLILTWKISSKLIVPSSIVKSSLSYSIINALASKIHAYHKSFFGRCYDVSRFNELFTYLVISKCEQSPLLNSCPIFMVSSLSPTRDSYYGLTECFLKMHTCAVILKFKQSANNYWNLLQLLRCICNACVGYDSKFSPLPHQIRIAKPN